MSDTKISEENSECLIGKSHIEFDLTYSLSQSELLSKLLHSFETTCFAGRAKFTIMCRKNCENRFTNKNGVAIDKRLSIANIR